MADCPNTSVVFWSDRLHDFTRCTVPREVDPTIEFLDRNSEIGNLLRQDSEAETGLG